MSKVKKNTKSKNKKEEEYNAENEIIIGVTTRPKEVKSNKKKRNSSINIKNKKSNRTSINKKPIKNSKKIKHVNNKNKLTKEQEIKKINRKKVIISFIVLLIICCAGCIYFLTTPIFNISNIEITGNNKNSIETYISLTKIELNSTNIFAITKNNIIKNIKENSYVESVEVQRKFPNTVKIDIKEREVAYQSEYNNQYIYLDKQGYILEINDKKEDIIRIIGLSSMKDAVYQGQRLIKEDLVKLDTVLKIVNYFKYNSIENKITTIDVSDTTNYTIKLEQEGKIVYLGNETKLNEKILKLKTILEKEKGNKVEIFINEDALNRNRIYIKPIQEKE